MLNAYELELLYRVEVLLDRLERKLGFKQCKIVNGKKKKKKGDDYEDESF